mgnify:CR=1 FL=1
MNIVLIAVSGIKTYVGSDCKANLDKASMNSTYLPVNKSTEVAEYLYFRESHVEHHSLSSYILSHPDHLANVDMGYLAMKHALTSTDLLAERDLESLRPIRSTLSANSGFATIPQCHLPGQRSLSR